VLFGVQGYVSPAAIICAAALLGGLLGFAPANRPVARLFLGDVGSLPLGLLSGWMLLDLAAHGALAAALLLPLYYLADATLTLLARLRRGERIWQAHRSHFYQRARDHGFSVLAVDSRIAGLNLVLVGLAAATLTWPAPTTTIGCVIAGCLLVGGLLKSFATPPPPPCPRT
jgi:UDP-N-acetylmuramyl pentapeptide phosphotransferase/UDP-N-acetylglucosamine-1-phosphate transferase